MKALKSYLLKYRRVVSILIHTLIIVLGYVLAFFIRFEFKVPSEYLMLMSKTMLIMVVIKIATFQYFGLFSGVWKYVSMDDLWRILKASVAATIVFVMFVVFFFGRTGFPRSIFILDWGLCVGLVAGIRFISRGVRERFRPVHRQKRSKALIIGAGETGLLVLRELKKSSNVDVVGFADDDIVKKGSRIHGKKVLGNTKDIENIVNEHEIEQIIIAIPSARGEVIREIVSYCQFPDVKIKIVPGFREIFSGELEVKLKDVQPEDLLSRESVNVNKDELKRYLKDKTILITGAGGSIGSELARQIMQFFPERLILVDYNENDLYFLERELRDRYVHFDLEAVTADVKEVSVLKHIFSTFRPQIVFHAAAFKHVPLMEENPASAVKNNILNSRNLIYASEHYGVESFVLISSDKAVNPTNVMGATKRIAEMLMQAKAKKSRTKFIAVRFGNVLGSKGSVVPLFKKQIEEERRVTVTHPEARRYFMSIKEAVQLVLQASAIGKGGEIFVLDMGEQIKIADFAKNLISLSGLKPEKDVAIEYIGLRPGEKLHEETLHDTEKDLATKHEKIFIAQPDDFDIKKLTKHVKELEKLANLMDSPKIVRKIREIVPTYIPSGKNGEE